MVNEVTLEKVFSGVSIVFPIWSSFHHWCRLISDCSM